jgi:hypothetical protein
MDRRRFHLTDNNLNESFSANQSKSLLENTFSELNRLYEADEQPSKTQDKVTDSGEKEEDTTITNISKLASIADKVDVPEKSIKLEGTADKLYDVMIKMLKRSSLPEAVKMLELISKDNKLKLLLQHGFAGGSAEDAKLNVTMSDASIPVRDLLPTQSEIGISNSLDNLVKGTFSAGKNADGSEKTGTVNYAEYFKTPALKAAGPVFVYRGKGGNYIVDGHHRWSQIYCMNPDASAYCKVISTSKTLSDEQILKNFQAAIAADPNRTGLGRKAAGFTNLFGADEGILKETVKSMSEEVATKIVDVVSADKLNSAAESVKIEDGSENQKKARAYLVANAKIVAGVQRPSDRKRILMPQTDKATFDIIDGAIAGI